MEVKAHLRHYKQSPRKVRLVTDLIRGLDTEEAITQLTFVQKRAARAVQKLLQSAVANAEHNFSLKSNNLFVKKIMVNTGPTLKRWRARAFGRAAGIQKRSAHITIILDERNPTAPSKITPVASKESAQKVTEVKSIDDVKKSAPKETDMKKTATDQKRGGKRGGFSPKKIFQRKAG